MAYCRHCGAYLPDNMTKCLSCGMDEAEIERQKQEAAQTARAPFNEELERMKKELEEQRRNQQEINRKWAETEYAQRKRAEQEKYNINIGSRLNQNNENKYKVSVNSSVILAALSYLGILFVLPLIFAKDDDFALYHSNQGIMLFISLIVMNIAASIVGMGWLSSLAGLYLIYRGMMNALNRKKEPLPFIGKLFNK